MAARVEALIVTLGGEGSRIYADGRILEIPRSNRRQVVDPTGCGDAYRAGLLLASDTAGIGSAPAALRRERMADDLDAPGALAAVDAWADAALAADSAGAGAAGEAALIRDRRRACFWRVTPPAQYRPAPTPSSNTFLALWITGALSTAPLLAFIFASTSPQAVPSHTTPPQLRTPSTPPRPSGRPWPSHRGPARERTHPTRGHRDSECGSARP